MPRHSRVNYYPSRHAYFCQISGKQHKLAEGPEDGPSGPTFLAALQAFRHLLEDAQSATSGNSNTVRVVCEHFMGRTMRAVEAGTHRRRGVLLRPFVAALGETRVARLQAEQLDTFLDSMRRPHTVSLGRGQTRLATWNDSTVCAFLRVAASAFNWAVRSKLIETNPLLGYPRPTIRSRGRDCLITPEQHQLFLRLCQSKGMRRILIALENTGARPSEILLATAADWDAEKQAILYYADTRRKVGEHRHKTAKHKDRTIFFSGEALELIQQLIKRHPTGPLFRKDSGKVYAEGAVAKFFSNFRTRPEVQLPSLTAYSYRHTFATNWLKSGRSIEILAELLGNSPTVIRRHYAHLCGDYQTLRRQLEAFKSPEEKT